MMVRKKKAKKFLSFVLTYKIVMWTLAKTLSVLKGKYCYISILTPSMNIFHNRLTVRVVNDRLGF